MPAGERFDWRVLNVSQDQWAEFCSYENRLADKGAGLTRDQMTGAGIYHSWITKPKVGGNKVYVASSWRNYLQQGVVHTLRAAGFEVYDFKHPKPGDNGFHWREIDGGWETWSAEQYRQALKHPIAKDGFASDFDAMKWADIGVLVLPCGRSAHLEAGYFVGAGKPLHILLCDQHNEPELMYSMATSINLNLGELLASLGVKD